MFPYHCHDENTVSHIWKKLSFFRNFARLIQKHLQAQNREAQIIKRNVVVIGQTELPRKEWVWGVTSLSVPIHQSQLFPFLGLSPAWSKASCNFERSLWIDLIPTTLFFVESHFKQMLKRLVESTTIQQLHWIMSRFYAEAVLPKISWVEWQNWLMLMKNVGVTRNLNYLVYEVVSEYCNTVLNTLLIRPVCFKCLFYLTFVLNTYL